MKYKPEKMTNTQVGQAVRALLELGETKIVVEKTEKGRITVATSDTPKK